MTMVERVARAAYAASCANDPLDGEAEPDWGRGGYKTQVIYWHAVARAAIAAMREPSEGIVMDGECWLAEPHTFGATVEEAARTAEGMWRFMIDAALAE